MLYVLIIDNDLVFCLLAFKFILRTIPLEKFDIAVEKGKLLKLNIMLVGPLWLEVKYYSLQIF